MSDFEYFTGKPEPEPRTIRSTYGKDDVVETEYVVISDQLGRMETLLIRILAELRK